MIKCPSASADNKTAHAEQDRFRKKTDPIYKLYSTAAWQRFRLWRLADNPLCQRIVKGERCHFGATTVHHLFSPRERPDLFYDAHNTVCLCANCHQGGLAGTPEWRKGIDYAE